MMRFFASVMGLAVAMTMSGCSMEPPLPASTTPAKSVAGLYRLGSGDKFKLNVYNEPNLSGGEYMINGAGEASLPLIGAVNVGGMTMREAEAAITARYATGYLSKPKVNIDVTVFRPFYILGEVNTPGEYPSGDNMTVLNAVAKAGGFTYRAARREVYIRHAGEANETKVEVAPDTPILPGDTVRIVERFF
jgi:polysaccharide export outer membrane protein